jgi:hypothetical protein
MNHRPHIELVEEVLAADHPIVVEGWATMPDLPEVYWGRRHRRQ